jgi:hypothetical protein
MKLFEPYTAYNGEVLIPVPPLENAYSICSRCVADDRSSDSMTPLCKSLPCTFDHPQNPSRIHVIFVRASDLDDYKTEAATLKLKGNLP